MEARSILSSSPRAETREEEEEDAAGGEEEEEEEEEGDLEVGRTFPNKIPFPIKQKKSTCQKSGVLLRNISRLNSNSSN